MQFGLATLADKSDAFPAVVVEGRARDLRLLLGVATTKGILERWGELLPAIQSVADSDEGEWRDVRELRFLPPVQPVGALYAAGANYREHVLEIMVDHKLGATGASDEDLRAEAAREIDDRAANGEPYVWIGAPSSISGAFDDVMLPSRGDNHDWELELGVIIGRRCHNVAAADALDVVAGYTICNDVTTRSLVPRKDIPMMGTDWMRSKNAPTFFPTGPYLVPAQFVADPHDLHVTLSLNGQVMQDASTDDMVFGIERLIEYVSSVVVLEPGDMIITGSPSGNGSHWGRYLRDGDVMESTIVGLGVQRNRVRTAR